MGPQLAPKHVGGSDKSTAASEGVSGCEAAASNASSTTLSSGNGQSPEVAAHQSMWADQAGGGTALPASTRAKMESRLGADLSSVKVHTSDQSTQLASRFGASAFTFGHDIHFGADK